MGSIGYTTLSRQSGLLNEMQAVANNIANSATTGYRSEGLIFSEYVKSAPGQESLSMGRANIRNTSLEQGTMSQTNGSFDLAIEGDGFFMVETPAGNRLTRAGNFTPNAEGDLVTADGYRVLDAGQAPMFVPGDAESISFGADGTLSADGQQLGQIGLFVPDEEAQILREDGVMFRVEGETLPAAGAQVLQGFLEGSNVNTIHQLARMIEVQRAYEMGQSFLDNEDKRIRAAIDNLMKSQEITMRALKIAATGMSAQQLRVETISNNLANMNTTAYNARRAEFADLHYQQISRAGTVNASDGTVLPTGVQVGLGVRPAAVSVYLNQGALSQTGNELDVAIDGNGYFEVTLPSGETAYTRDGSFKRSAEGLIVTNDGYPVSPEITIPEDANSISINAEGEVYAYFNDTVEAELLGQLTLSGFTNPKGLEAVGSNLFKQTEASGQPNTTEPGADGVGTLRQKYLEDSSVDAVREITELIEAQRGYEMNSKVISAVDQMMSATTQVR